MLDIVFITYNKIWSIDITMQLACYMLPYTHSPLQMFTLHIFVRLITAFQLTDFSRSLSYQRWVQSC